MIEPTFKLDVSGMERWESASLEAIMEGAQAGIQESILLFERGAKQKIMEGRDVRHFGPAVFTGTLESHVVSEMDQVGLRTQGFVSVAPPADQYALVLEEGRTTGAKMPYSEWLVPWVTEKIGDAGIQASKRVLASPDVQESFEKAGKNLRQPSSVEKRIKGLAFVIARSIAEKGFPGVHMFRNTFGEQQENMVAIVHDRIQEAVDARVNKPQEGA